MSSVFITYTLCCMARYEHTVSMAYNKRIKHIKRFSKMKEKRDMNDNAKSMGSYCPTKYR